MATGVGVGFDLGGLDTKLKALDAQLDKLIKKQEKLGKTTIDTFRQMVSNGVEPVIQGLAKQRAELEALSKIKGGGAMSEIKKEAKSALKEIDKVINAIKRTTTYKEYSTGNDDATRYENWLRRKHREEQEHKRVESEKTKATQQAIAQQNAEYKKQEEIVRQAHLASQRAKENSEQRRPIIDENTYAMYARMFDEISRREQQYTQERHARNEQQKKEKQKQLADEIKAYQQYQQRMADLEKARAAQQSANRRAAYQDTMLGGIGGLRSADNAMRYTDRIYSDKGLKSINNMNNAIQQMRDAQQRLNLSTAEGQKKYEELNKAIKRVQDDINRTTKAQENFGKASHNLINTGQQLARQFALVFSVSQISGYINKMIDVRKEFELQQRSLQIILQNKDMANEIWNQTIELAVKSPFRIKELVTYTKQLAAYRIESDKLHDTTKRLADISAGLGVDMQRLILAYGQIRAAEFLRGTELRQLTEAGIPMLEELAAHFTELEGRAVSTGEAFERISKRMVLFEDVNAVIQKMTDEGGVFFQMQEQQAETLHGMISNLYDSIDVMLNDIGASNDGALKSAVSAVRDLVQNWEELAIRIKAIVSAFAVWKIGNAAYILGSKQATAATALSISAIRAKTTALFGEIKALNLTSLRMNAALLTTVLFTKASKVLAITLHGVKVALKSFLPLLIAGAIVEFIISLGEAAREAERLKEALNAIDVELGSDMSDNISNYHHLAAVIKDVTSSQEEREKAMQAIKRIFGDILPDQYLELQYIQNTSDGYKAATQAMKLYYSEKAREQKKAKIDEEFQEDIEDATKGLAVTLDKTNPLWDSRYSKQVINEYIEDFKKGKVQLENIYKDLLNRFNAFYGTSTKNFVGISQNLVFSLRDELKKYQEEIDNITGLPAETLKETQEIERTTKLRQQLEEETGILTELQTAYSNYYKQKSIASKASDEEIKRNALTSMQQYQKDIEKIYKDLNIQMPQIEGTTEWSVSIRDEMNRVTKVVHENFQKTIGDVPSQFNDEIKQAIENLNPTDLQRGTKVLFEAVANQYKVPLGIFDQLKVDSKDTVETVRENLKKLITAAKDIVNAYEMSKKSSVSLLNEETRKLIHGMTDEQVENKKKELTALEAALKALGGSEDNTSKNRGGRSNQRDIWGERISLVKDLQKAYEDLNKVFSETDSKQRVIGSYTKTFNSLFSKLGMTIDGIDFTKPEGVVDALEKMLPSLKEGTKEWDKLQKAISETQVNIDKEKKRKDDENLNQQVERMFDEYELSLELQKLDFPPDLAEQIFGIDTITLDGLKTKLEELKPQFVGKEQEEEYNNFLDKLTEMEDKKRVEDLKKYTKYLIQAQSEVTKIKLNEMDMLDDISSLKVDGRTKELMRLGVKEDTEKEMDKAIWENFKSSATYEQLFGDIENLGTKSIDILLKKLSEMKDALKTLPPEVYKEIQNSISKLEELRLERNPFVGFLDAMKEAKDAAKTSVIVDGKKLKGEDAVAYNLQNAEALVASYNEQITKLEQIKKANGDINKLKEVGVELSEEETSKYLGKDVAVLDNEIAVLKNAIANAEGDVSANADKLNKIQKAKVALEKTKAQTEAWGEAIKGVLGGMDSILDAFGVAEDSSARLWINSTMQIADMVVQVIILTASLQAMGVAANTALGVIGWIAMGLQAVGLLFASIFSMHDKKKEKQIQREIELVEKLQNAYEKLEKAIDSAYNINTLESSYDLAKDNLKQQIAATERMIEAEEDKKDTDHDRIKEWRNEIEDYKEQLEELETQRIESLGGIGSDEGYKSAAEDFVNAWLEAYKETGDGLKGLEDEFNSIMENFVKKQLVQRVLGGYLAPILKKIDEAVGAADEEQLSATEVSERLNAALDVFDASKEDVNSLMSILIERLNMGNWLNSSNLSGLQKGIQGITEEQAEVLAAYWNTVRFLTANIDKTLTSIAGNILSDYENENDNPMLSELRTQTDIIRSIRDSFESVIGRGGSSTHGGAYLKVMI